MKKLLIATNNKGKVAEIQDLLKGLAVPLVTPNDLGITLQVEEDGSTYAENAEKKALAFAHASDLISLADDSGLEVDALDGAPGLYSNRYLSKSNATDGERRAYLLKNLKDNRLNHVYNGWQCCILYGNRHYPGNVGQRKDFIERSNRVNRITEIRISPFFRYFF